jgi:uncharacterized protein
MNKMIFFIIFFLVSGIAFGQREFTYTENDSVFTMKRYVFMLLDKGDNRTQDSTEAVLIQEQHMAHLKKMADTGKLILAGPFENGGDHRGLLVFDIETLEEALELEGEDPAVKSGRLKMDAFYWWAAKGSVLK